MFKELVEKILHMSWLFGDLRWTEGILDEHCWGGSLYHPQSNKQRTHTWQFCWCPFWDREKRDPFKGCWWPPNRGWKGHGLNHLVCYMLLMLLEWSLITLHFPHGHGGTANIGTLKMPIGFLLTICELCKPATKRGDVDSKYCYDMWIMCFELCLLCWRLWWCECHSRGRFPIILRVSTCLYDVCGPLSDLNGIVMNHPLVALFPATNNEGLGVMELANSLVSRETPLCVCLCFTAKKKWPDFLILLILSLAKCRDFKNHFAPYIYTHILVEL